MASKPLESAAVLRRCPAPRRTPCRRCRDAVVLQILRAMLMRSSLTSTPSTSIAPRCAASTAVAPCPQPKSRTRIPSKGMPPGKREQKYSAFENRSSKYERSCCSTAGIEAAFFTLVSGEASAPCDVPSQRAGARAPSGPLWPWRCSRSSCRRLWPSCPFTDQVARELGDLRPDRHDSAGQTQVPPG